MDFNYTILILLLPVLSFLVLGLAGMRMTHKMAGAIGTTVLTAVAALSYVTAYLYFGNGRVADGTFATLMLAYILIHVASTNRGFSVVKLPVLPMLTTPGFAFDVPSMPVLSAFELPQLLSRQVVAAVAVVRPSARRKLRRDTFFMLFVVPFKIQKWVRDAAHPGFRQNAPAGKLLLKTM